MSYRRTINLKMAGSLETSNVEVRIVIRFWSVKVSRRWGYVASWRGCTRHACLGKWCGYGALLLLKPGQVLTISDRESRARSLQIAVCVMQIALSERTYSLR